MRLVHKHYTACCARRSADKCSAWRTAYVDFCVRAPVYLSLIEAQVIDLHLDKARISSGYLVQRAKMTTRCMDVTRSFGFLYVEEEEGELGSERRAKAFGGGCMASCVR